MKYLKIAVVVLIIFVLLGLIIITSIKIYQSKVVNSKIDRVPKYALLLADKQYFLLDREYLYINKQVKTSLPQLDASVASLNLKAGEKATKEIINALQLFDLIKLTYGVNSGILYADYVEFKEIDSKYSVQFPIDGSKSTPALMGGLLLIIRQLNEVDNNSRIAKDKEYSQIDFRFKNPVLR